LFKKNFLKEFCEINITNVFLSVQNIKSWSAGFPARLTSILQAGMPAFQYSFTLQNRFVTMTKSLLQGVKWFCRYDKIIIARCKIVLSL